MRKSVPNTVSFWGKSYFEDTDWLIIGAGLVGLQCATEIKLAYPAKRVVVIDQGVIGNAASLRNAGFACFGSAGELLDEIERSGKDAAFNLYLQRFYGIQRLIQKFGAAAIGFEPTGGFEVFTHAETTKLELLQHEIPWLNQELNYFLRNQHRPFIHEFKRSAVDLFSVQSIADSGMNICPLSIVASEEGPLQTHRLYRSVRTLATQSGVEICESFRIASYEDRVGGVVVYADDGETIQTEQLLLCTNGFTQSLDKQAPVLPARGQVFVTESLPWQPLKGLYHADDGYLYFRNLGDRILIGGGRNIDMKTEETMEMENTQTIREYIREYLQDVILPLRKSMGGLKFDYEWSGIMGMGPQRTPIIGADSNRVYMAVRMGGMGVALSAWVAEEVLKLIQLNDGK
jgi:glycine/D-amino acid oxidase-like deaminating enzyme